ncbi:MAG: RIP metalloprotease RseP [Bacillota bacterium]|jgi:regulator of sigma E protease
MTIVLSILIFGLLILVHEFGHFIVAKLADVKIDEFSLGMGPKVMQKKKGETVYSLRWFPIGGFVKMAGMEPGEDDEPRGFNKKTVLQRAAIIFAGPLMNFITALVLFILVFMVVGIPSDTNVIGKVVSGAPAETAGLKSGDKIIQIQGTQVATWKEMVLAIRQHPQETIKLIVLRDGSKKEITVVPEKDPDTGNGQIGILQSWERKGFFTSITLGLERTYEFTKLLVVSLGQMITGTVKAEVAGPIGVVQMVGEVARYGLASIMTFAGILSINLGVINLFPIPALDGSRLVFLGLEGVRGCPIDPEKENFVHLIGFALLMILMVVITYNDILRLIS